MTLDDGNFTVSYTVTNQGNAMAGASTTCKYVDDELTESQPCQALVPGASYSSAFTPEPCPCGETLEVQVCADDNDVVGESDETNNCETNIIGCPPCLPDLVVSKSVTLDDGNFTVSYTVTNQGNAMAGASTTCKYVDDELTESQPCQALAPGASYSSAFDPEPCPLCVETFEVKVCADHHEAVTESNETNNCDVSYVGPDLVATINSVTFDDGNFTVSYTVTNQGNVPAPESATCKYVDNELPESQPGIGSRCELQQRIYPRALPLRGDP